MSVMGLLGWFEKRDEGRRLTDARLLHELTVPSGKVGDSRPVISSVAITADGARAISGHADGIVRLWNVPAGRLLSSSHAHDWGAVCVDVDGQFAASGCRDGSIVAWDLRDGNLVPLAQISVKPDMVNGICMSSEADLILATFERQFSEEKAVFWNLRSGERVGALTAKGPSGCANPRIDRSGARVVVGAEHGRLLTWDRNTPHEPREIGAHPRGVLGSPFTALSRDGRRAASGMWGLGDMSDKTVKIWDFDSGACIVSFNGLTSGVASIGLNGVGSVVLTTSLDNSACIWNAVDGDQFASLPGHAVPPCGAVSEDAEYAVTGSFDDPLRIWKLDWA